MEFLTIVGETGQYLEMLGKLQRIHEVESNAVNIEN
jgi:hypothetical protein